ncbi:hypothetical protein A2U01_0070353, partial [Trifolium medium]|nr:hypothetical protein [Trifolium medium]
MARRPKGSEQESTVTFAMALLAAVSLLEL